MAFAELMDASTVQLLAFVRRIGGDLLAGDCDAEDVLQAVFATAWSRLPEFEDRGPGAFHRWLVAIARRAVSDRGKYLRARGRDRLRAPGGGGDLATLPASQTSISVGAERRERCARLLVALDALPGNRREVVEAHLLRGESLAEIAARLRISKNAAWERLRRGLARLSERMDDA